MGADRTTSSAEAVTYQLGVANGIATGGATDAISFYAAYADVDFDLQGVPATTLSGSARLAPTGSGSTLTYQLDLDVEIPFFGSMIEKAVLDQVARAFDKEAHVIRSS